MPDEKRGLSTKDDRAGPVAHVTGTRHRRTAAGGGGCSYAEQRRMPPSPSPDYRRRRNRNAPSFFSACNAKEMAIGLEPANLFGCAVARNASRICVATRSSLRRSTLLDTHTFDSEESNFHEVSFRLSDLRDYRLYRVLSVVVACRCL